MVNNYLSDILTPTKMRYTFSIVFFTLLFLSAGLRAQEKYTVQGKAHLLYTEVEGSLTLLWEKEGKKYRFFSKKGDEIIELKNTKVDKKYQEEYKTVLREQTQDASIAVDKVKFTPRSLSAFYIAYNSKIDPEYATNRMPTEIQFRLGAFAGVDNAVFTENPENAMLPVAGVEFEVLDIKSLKRHALAIQFKQTFESSNYTYNSTQISVNYRFKFIKTPRFDVFVNAKFATVTFSNYEYEAVEEGTNELKTYSESSSGLNAPFMFGIGADYKVGNGYITLGINDLVGLNVDSNNEFPINLTLGYKFIL